MASPFYPRRSRPRWPSAKISAGAAEIPVQRALLCCEYLLCQRALEQVTVTMLRAKGWARSPCCQRHADVDSGAEPLLGDPTPQRVIAVTPGLPVGQDSPRSVPLAGERDLWPDPAVGLASGCVATERELPIAEGQRGRPPGRVV